VYTPDHFRVTDPTTLCGAIRRIGVGHLVTVGPEGLMASFVPLLVDDDATTVTGHLARANPQWRNTDTSVPALLTWVGPDTYVSPSWYPSTTEHGRVVPTWNYITVQARGEIRFPTDAGWKRAQVAALTDTHEAGSESPWALDDAPAAYVDRMLRAIVGFEVRVTSLEGAWKLSQNRSAADVAGVVAGLRARTGDVRAAEVAEAMSTVDGTATGD